MSDGSHHHKFDAIDENKDSFSLGGRGRVPTHEWIHCVGHSCSCLMIILKCVGCKVWSNFLCFETVTPTRMMSSCRNRTPCCICLKEFWMKFQSHLGRTVGSRLDKSRLKITSALLKPSRGSSSPYIPTKVEETFLHRNFLSVSIFSRWQRYTSNAQWPTVGRTGDSCTSDRPLKWRYRTEVEANVEAERTWLQNYLKIPPPRKLWVHMCPKLKATKLSRVCINLKPCDLFGFIMS